MTQPVTIRVKRKSSETKPFNIELEQEDGNVKTYTFHGKPQIPGSLLLDVVASGSLGSEWQAAAVRKLFTEAIVPEELAQFTELLDHSDPPIEMNELNEVVKTLVEFYGDRPTQSATP